MVKVGKTLVTLAVNVFLLVNVALVYNIHTERSVKHNTILDRNRLGKHLFIT